MNTPVKKVLCEIDVNSLCRVCNINISISGRGKFHLFDGKASKKQNIATRLSLVLDCPVERSDVSSCICNKCRRELEKLEKYQIYLQNFKQLSNKTLHKQSGTAATQRVIRCHRGNSPSSAKIPLRKKTATARRILYPANLNRTFHEDACVTKPRTASSVEVRSTHFIDRSFQIIIDTN